jgi:NADH:ubiquinone oxidoreductase subunit 4 (subunit M)
MIVMILIPKSYERVLLDIARDISIICFIFILILFYEFDKSTLGFQFSQEINIITNYNIFFSVGIDGISLCFMLLTAFIMPLCIIAAESIKRFSKEFLIYLLLIEFLLLISFSTTDLFFFYVFFESVLIPMFIIIGI